MWPVSLGFHRVETIDDDLGISVSGFAGFWRLLITVCAGTAGAVLALEASRLARNDRDWSQLVELGAITNVVLIDHDGIYDQRQVNDRLLLGLSLRVVFASCASSLRTQPRRRSRRRQR